MEQCGDNLVRPFLLCSADFRVSKRVVSSVQAKKVQVRALDSALPLCSKRMYFAYRSVQHSPRSWNSLKQGPFLLDEQDRVDSALNWNNQHQWPVEKSNSFDHVLHTDQACTGVCPAGTSIWVVHQTQIYPRAKESQRTTVHDPMDINLGCGRYSTIPSNSAYFLLLEPVDFQWNQLGQAVL